MVAVSLKMGRFAWKSVTSAIHAAATHMKVFIAMKSHQREVT